MLNDPNTAQERNLENLYCKILGITVPRLEDVVSHREAGAFSLLLVALLEHGAPMTLEAVATRLAEAGLGKRAAVLASLRRCRPGRPPAYRKDDLYGLDPHDAELELWAFRLGLRPPKAAAVSIVRPPPPPPPSQDAPLSLEELRFAWRGTPLGTWSAQRLALAVLDAHAVPMLPSQVVAFLSGMDPQHRLTEDAIELWRQGAVQARYDGRWIPQADHPALLGARRAVRARVLVLQRNAHLRQDPAVTHAYVQAAERRRVAHANKLAGLSRVILCSYPPQNPCAVVLIDVADRTLSTFQQPTLDAARARLEAYDIIAGVGVRAAVDGLGLQSEGRRLGELSPAQKTRQINDRGKILKITTAMLIAHTCLISKPLGDPKKLQGYCNKQQWEPLCKRLEADAKALYAFYQYGRLHGHVRLRWGFMDDTMPAPWVHYDERGFFELLRSAEERGAVLEVVAGVTPSWTDPWQGAQRCRVQALSPYEYVLIDEKNAEVMDPDDVQLVRPASALRR